MLHPRDRVVGQIRMLRSVGIARPRRRLPRQIPPDALRLSYFKALRTDVLAPMRATVQHNLIPKLAGMLAHAAARRGDARYDIIHRDTAGDDVDQIARAFFDTLSPRALADVARRYGEATSSYQRAQVARQASAALGVDPTPILGDARISPLVDDFVVDNVALIKSIPQQYFSEIERLVTAAVRTGTRWEDLAQQIDERYDVSESRARLIARDQVGKFYGELQRVRQEQMGVSHYIWRTVNDNRVRPDHQEREGRRYAWNDPPADGPPGQAINCRCYAEPDFSEVVAQAREEAPAPTPTPTPTTAAPEPPAPAPTSVDGSESIDDFGARVMTAGRAATTGRVGDDRVFISHLWRQVADRMSLSDFKLRLLQAQRAGLIGMSRADLVEAYDPRDVTESEIRFLEASYHFLRTDFKRRVKK